MARTLRLLDEEKEYIDMVIEKFKAFADKAIRVLEPKQKRGPERNPVAFERELLVNAMTRVLFAATQLRLIDQIQKLIQQVNSDDEYLPVQQRLLCSMFQDWADELSHSIDEDKKHASLLFSDFQIAATERELIESFADECFSFLRGCESDWFRKYSKADEERLAQSGWVKLNIGNKSALFNMGGVLAAISSDEGCTQIQIDYAVKLAQSHLESKNEDWKHTQTLDDNDSAQLQASLQTFRDRLSQDQTRLDDVHSLSVVKESLSCGQIPALELFAMKAAKVHHKEIAVQAGKSVDVVDKYWKSLKSKLKTAHPESAGADYRIVRWWSGKTDLYEKSALRRKRPGR